MGDILHALRAQTADMSAAEILVVGSDVPGLVVEDELVRLIPAGRLVNAAVKRNLGMRQAQGDLLLFLDDDCLPTPDWVERHLSRHAQGEQVVGGGISFGSDNYLQLADNVSAFHDFLPFLPEGPRPYLATANLSLRRTVMEKAGEMDAGLGRAHDLEWTARFRRLGYTLYFEPRARIFHDPFRRSLSAVWRHWTADAPDTLSVRLRYARLLRTPHLARFRWLFLWGGPCVAAWATARTFGHTRILRQYWHTLPLVYLTKLAWCWSAFWNFPAGSSPEAA
jgi:GT2 family glycosyltransferase